MDNIPKIFWYAVSFAIVTITITLIALSWRAQSVSVEISSTKINLSRAIQDVQSVADALEAKEKELQATKQKLVAATRPVIIEPVKPIIDEKFKANIRETLNTAQQQVQRKD